MPELDALLRFLGPGASPAVVLFLAALYARKVVWGWQYQELYEAHQELKRIVLHSLEAAEKSTTAAEKALDVVPAAKGPRGEA